MNSESGLATAKTEANESFNEATANHDKLLAGRARQLSAAAPAAAGTHVTSFDSGHAFPGVLPDLTAEADAALGQYRPETLQYAPRPGLAELRKWIAEYMRADGGCHLEAEQNMRWNWSADCFSTRAMPLLSPRPRTLPRFQSSGVLELSSSKSHRIAKGFALRSSKKC